MGEQEIKTSERIQTIKLKVDSIFNTEQLSSEELRRFSIAIQELKKTKRGEAILEALENAQIEIIIKMNNSSRNKYNPVDKTLEWDSNKNLLSVDGNIVDAITLLGHEIGHAYQDIIEQRLLVYTDEKIKKNEEDNIRVNENPIAMERNNYIRKSYNEILLPRPYTLRIFLEEK